MKKSTNDEKFKNTFSTLYNLELSQKELKTIHTNLSLFTQTLINYYGRTSNTQNFTAEVESLKNGKYRTDAKVSKIPQM